MASNVATKEGVLTVGSEVDKKDKRLTLIMEDKTQLIMMFINRAQAEDIIWNLKDRFKL